MSNKICPVCGSEHIKLNVEEQIIKEPFGGQNIIKINNYICNDCGSTGDFFNENENLISKNITELKHMAIENILNDFTQNKISLSAIERALELPQRTLTKWKNNVASPSSSGATLLKFIRLFPWLLEVAENKFDYSIAQKIHINAAVQKIINSIDFYQNDFVEAGVVATARSMFMYLQFEKKEKTITYTPTDNYLQVYTS